MKIQHNRETIMTKCEQFLECQMEWSKAAYAHNEQAKKAWICRGHAIRDSFSKEDWEELIGQSTGRAKYEYTRMMNERFPNDNEQNKKIKILTILNETHTCVIIISHLCVW